MNIPYRYFRINGGSVLTAYNEFIALRAKQTEERNALAVEFGAGGTYASDREVRGLIFAKNANIPDGWVPVKGVDGTYKPPMGNATKAIRERFGNSRLVSWRDLHKAIAGDVFGVMGGRAEGGGIRCCFCHVETWKKHDESDGACLILCMPCNGESGRKWQPPEDCVEIKTSAYWHIREASASPEDKAEDED